MRKDLAALLLVHSAALFYALSPNCASSAEIDMTRHWDDKVALENPHKGWYHHYPDNGLTKYKIARDVDLLEFPGMDHVYVRLAWSYLEPEEGRFNWDIIDRIIDKWTGHGLGIAFRISCRETGTKPVEQQFATPRWVMEAGAKGGFYYKGEETGPEGPWEPVFDDPVFLEKLEGFLETFGARYDGKPWLRYVDIGSIGDWGEGHTSSGSHKRYGFDQRKPHVDLYRKYFRDTQLVITDDFVYCVPEGEQRDRMHQYILDNDITYRDDSILVDYYIRAYADTCAVRSPEYFADTWLKGPNVFELEHYPGVRSKGNWLGKPGSTLALHGGGRSGADYFRGALELLHATYIGYHGYADQWLVENRELTVELLNRCGYWYFLHGLRLSDTWKPGELHAVAITWENRGVAPAYHDFDLIFRLEGPKTIDLSVPAGNRRWVPDAKGKTYVARYRLTVPEPLGPGSYVLKLKLFSKHAERDVLLALQRELLDDENFYRIGRVEVAKQLAVERNSFRSFVGLEHPHWPSQGTE
jgi:hypothetical protein